MSKKSDKDKPKKKSKKKDSSNSSIAKRVPNLLAKSEKHYTVGSLEEALYKLFPKDTQETWDRSGLIVGERSLPVTCVAVALDPTVDAIKKASAFGANVLITHHPLFLDPPTTFSPVESSAIDPGAGVWAAIQYKMNVMNFHTCLDVSRSSQQILPKMLYLDFQGELLQTIPQDKHLGYGQICKVKASKDEDVTLSRLAARCTSVFGRAPRVWGDPQRHIEKVACALGSASSLADDCIRADIDCLICGEIRYHTALGLAQEGMSIIELGHDISEMPLTAILARSLVDLGISKDWIKVIDQTDNWHYPEAIRL